jgi:hypothetical protein
MARIRLDLRRLEVRGQAPASLANAPSSSTLPLKTRGPRLKYGCGRRGPFVYGAAGPVAADLVYVRSLGTAYTNETEGSEPPAPALPASLHSPPQAPCSRPPERLFPVAAVQAERRSSINEVSVHLGRSMFGMRQRCAAATGVQTAAVTTASDTMTRILIQERSVHRRVVEILKTTKCTADDVERLRTVRTSTRPRALLNHHRPRGSHRCLNPCLKRGPTDLYLAYPDSFRRA